MQERKGALAVAACIDRCIDSVCYTPAAIEGLMAYLLRYVVVWVVGTSGTVRDAGCGQLGACTSSLAAGLAVQPTGGTLREVSRSSHVYGRRCSKTCISQLDKQPTIATGAFKDGS